MKRASNQVGRNLRRAASLVAAGLAAIALSTTFGAPAAASPLDVDAIKGSLGQADRATLQGATDGGIGTQAWSQCPEDHFCFWDQGGSLGNFGMWRPTACWQEWNIGFAGWGDRIVSGWNRTSSGVPSRPYWIRLWNWTGSQWEHLYSFPPGNPGGYGDLPSWARYRADRLTAECPWQ